MNIEYCILSVLNNNLWKSANPWKHYAEKDVICVLVSAEQRDSVFEAMFRAGELDRPNAGFVYVTKLERLAAYVPESIMSELREAGKVRSAL